MDKFGVMLFAVLAATIAAPAVAQDEDAKDPKPNVLVIMASDLGFADLSCYGGDIRTITLDLLAEDGQRFTQFYTPGRGESSRVSLLTGHYYDQLGAARPGWVQTLPQRLKDADYRSYHSGKWGLERWYRKPIASAGFDRSYHLADTEQHFWPSEHYLDGQRLEAVERNDDYNATKACADYMIDFLEEHNERHKDKPFFAYLSFTAPHHPLQAEADEIADFGDEFKDGWDARRARIFVKQKQIGLIDTDLARLEPSIDAPGSSLEQRRQLGPGEAANAVRWFELTDEQQRFQAQKMRIYAAMVTRMDREIGRVISQLRRMRAYDNTLILFMSDNGASSEIVIGEDGHNPAATPGSGDSYLCLGPGWASSSNTPFRRHKLTTYEGGISVPMIAHWRRELEDEGELIDEVSHVIDIVPTILKLAGLEQKKEEGVPMLPGVELTPVLTGDGKYPERELYFNHNGNRAFRMGYWKIVAQANDRAWSMYDMRDDRAEENSVSKRHPEKFLELTMRWERFNKDFQEDSQR
jgi:arylsulfatase